MSLCICGVYALKTITSIPLSDDWLLQIQSGKTRSGPIDPKHPRSSGKRCGPRHEKRAGDKRCRLPEPKAGQLFSRSGLTRCGCADRPACTSCRQASRRKRAERHRCSKPRLSPGTHPANEDRTPVGPIAPRRGSCCAKPGRNRRRSVDRRSCRLSLEPACRPATAGRPCSDLQPHVVGDVLAQRQLAVDMLARQRLIGVILRNQLAGQAMKAGLVLRRPPVAQIAVGIELAA